ncbi:MAG TPA: DUF1800 family protein, partial [Gemmatimonadaceae bacterium]|nr:DUF1800 family protein [Gemmatimonadaceae bacterium]
RTETDRHQREGAGLEKDTPLHRPISAGSLVIRARLEASRLTPRAARMVAQLGQPLYGHRDPNGWPERSSEWLSAGSVVSRINFGVALAGRAALGDSLRRALESPDFQRR